MRGWWLLARIIDAGVCQALYQPFESLDDVRLLSEFCLLVEQGTCHLVHSGLQVHQAHLERVDSIIQLIVFHI